MSDFMYFGASNYGESLELGPQMAMPNLAGDFYNEPDDVTRGLSLYNGADDLSQMQDFYNPNMFGKACGFETEFDAPRDGLWSGLPVSGVIFQEGDEALEAPEDEFFQLAHTTIIIRDASAVQIGNQLVDFLRSEADGVITKVNRRKFTIKAEICLDGLNCETKVRVYKQALGQYAVEMQRRAGDTLAFHKLYQWASERLHSHTNSNESHLAMVSDIKPKFAAVPEHFTEGGATSSISVAPLLDLAECYADPNLQTEALQGLLQAANNANSIVQLCTPHAFMIYRNLLQLLCCNIAEPLARLLCCLALLPQAEFFTDEHTLHAMIKKVSSSSLGQPASKELAQAVCHIITQHAVGISPTANRELTFTLTEKLKEVPPESDANAQYLTTTHYLQESLQMLRLRRPCQAEQACF